MNRARLHCGLCQKGAYFRSDPHVGYGAEVMRAKATATIEEEQAWRALQFEPCHGLWQTTACRSIHADGESDFVFMKERLECERLHHFVVLEHRVQTDYIHIIA